jgi:hypothetical protein
MVSKPDLLIRFNLSLYMININEFHTFRFNHMSYPLFMMLYIFFFYLIIMFIRNKNFQNCNDLFS